MLAPWHDLLPIVTLQYTVYLAAADPMADCFFVTFLQLGSIQHLTFFRLRHERLKQGFFFLEAHVATVPWVVIILCFSN